MSRVEGELVAVMGRVGVRWLLLPGTIKILKTKRDGKVVAEGVQKILVCELLESHACSIEVPVVVEEMRAGVVRAARGDNLRLIAVAAWQVDSRAGHHELFKGGVLFVIEERGFVFET
jgi:hypothetical protein